MYSLANIFSKRNVYFHTVHL